MKCHKLWKKEEVLLSFAEDDGGVTVDFTETTIEMEAEESIQEWYGDITDKLEDAGTRRM